MWRNSTLSKDRELKMRIKTLWMIGVLALGAAGISTAQAPSAATTACPSCSNVPDTICDECVAAAANNPNLVQSTTPASWLNSGLTAAAFNGYDNGMAGGRVLPSLEYVHVVTDYAISGGASSCQSCGPNALLEDIHTGIESTFSLQHKRLFRSRMWKDATGFGKRWTYNFDIALSIDPSPGFTNATLRFPTKAYWKWIDVGNTGVFVEHGSLAKETTKATFQIVPGGYLVTTKYGEKIHLVPMADDPRVDYRPDYMESKNGFRLTFAYDAVADGIDRLESVTDTFGRSLTYEWSLLGAQHVITKVTLPDGREIHYHFTGLNDYTVTYPNGDVSSYSASWAPMGGKYYRFNDAKGDLGARKHRVTTRASGQVAKIEDLEGHLLYEALVVGPFAVQHKFLTGKVLNYTTSTNGYPVTMTNQATGALRTTTWDELAYLPLSQTDYLGNTTSYTYADNELVAIDYADGTSEHMAYAGALRKSFTDRLGRQHDYAFDAKGNLIKHTYPDGSFEAWTVGAYGQTLTFRNRNGAVTTAEYDGFGNLAKLILPDDDAVPTNNPTWVYTSDVNGRRLSQVDPMGRLTTFEYDAVDRLVKTTYPDGTTRESVNGTNGSNPLDPAGTTGLVVAEKDRNDSWTTFTYDLLDNRLTEADALGTRLTRTFMPGTDLALSEDREGDFEYFTYDSQGRLATSSLAANSGTTLTTAFEYDALDRVIKTTDPYGFKRYTAFDNMGREALLKAEYATGMDVKESYGYDAMGNRITRIDANGNTWLMDYDLNDRVGRTVDPLGAEVLYTYDPVGNRLSAAVQIEAARFGTTSWTYTARNKVATELDPIGNLLTYTYFLDDNPESAGNTGTGGLTTYVYSCCGRMTDSLVFIDGGAKDIAEHFAYDGNGNQILRTDGEGFVWRTLFDVRGRVVRQIDPLGKEVKTRYFEDGQPFDASLSSGQGQAIVVTDANGHATTTVFDAAGRPIATIDALGNAALTSFDHLSSGQVGTSTTNRNGVVSWHWADGLDRMVKQVDGLGGATVRTYDPNGNLVSIEDANHHVTAYAYDAANRLVAETYADGLTVSKAYYKNGGPKSRTDQNGNTKTFLVDDAGHRLKTLYPGPVEDVFTYDLGGRLTSAVAGQYATGFPVTRAYDPANRLALETQGIKSLAYAYDRRSLKTVLTMPESEQIHYGYTGRGELQSVEALGTTYLQEFFDPAGRLAVKAFDNGALTKLTYDARDRVTQIAHTHGATDLGTLAYTYDAEGNQLTEEDVTFPSRSQSFVFDALDRLVDWQRGPLPGPPTSTQIWSLDPVANWNSTTIDGTFEGCVHDAVNELMSIGPTTFHYDFNGNLTSDGVFDYVWDFNDRLKSVSLTGGGPLVAEYAYDALGRRVMRIDYVTPEDRTYVYDGTQVVREYTLAFKHVATYLYGNTIDEPIAKVDKKTYYFHPNAHFSPALLTDQSGGVVERYEYNAYGEATTFDATWANPMATSRFGNPYLFTGRRLDPETGLMYFRARMYSPEMGRFVSRDPSGYVDGMNLYRGYFVPNGTDPTGTRWARVQGTYDCGGTNVVISMWVEYRPFFGSPLCESPIADPRYGGTCRCRWLLAYGCHEVTWPTY